ncbi:hypothetical protein CPC08DRAFT_763722 [Agrocybe pediades]|nr:hypothetical protein CPC08DRAFT_763722 [Agrocybe pediades]
MQFISKPLFITMAMLASTLVVSAAPEGALNMTAYYTYQMLQPTLPALTKPFLLGMGVVPESIPTRAGSTATTGGAGPSQILGATATATALETRLATLAAEGAVQPPEGVPGCWEVQVLHFTNNAPSPNPAVFIVTNVIHYRLLSTETMSSSTGYYPTSRFATPAKAVANVRAHTLLPPPGPLPVPFSPISGFTTPTTSWTPTSSGTPAPTTTTTISAEVHWCKSTEDRLRRCRLLPLGSRICRCYHLQYSIRGRNISIDYTSITCANANAQLSHRRLRLFTNHLRHVVKIELQHAQALQQQHRPQDREHEEDTESPISTTTRTQTGTGRGPLKRPGAVAVLVPNSLPLPGPSHPKRGVVEDDLDMDMDVQSDRKENGHRLSGTI